MNIEDSIVSKSSSLASQTQINGDLIHSPSLTWTQKFFNMDLVIKRLSVIPFAGIALGLLSGIFIAIGGFIVKLVPDINPIEVVISRSVIQALVYLPVIVWNGMPIFGIRGERIALLLRGLSGFCSFCSLYVAYRMIPLADASTIVLSAPVMVSIFACILLKEECGMFQTSIVSFTIVGVFLIARPSFLFGDSVGDSAALRLEGTIVAIVASFFTAFNFIVIKKLPNTPPAVIIHAFSTTCIIMGTIALILIRNLFSSEAGFLAEGVVVPTTVKDIGLLIANGMCGVMGQLCLTTALKIEDASLVSLARTMNIVTTFILQIVWLPEEEVKWTCILGAAIICLGVCISAVRNLLKHRPGKCDMIWCLISCGQGNRVVVSDRSTDSHAVPDEIISQQPKSTKENTGKLRLS